MIELRNKLRNEKLSERDKRTLLTELKRRAGVIEISQTATNALCKWVEEFVTSLYDPELLELTRRNQTFPKTRRAFVIDPFYLDLTEKPLDQDWWFKAVYPNEVWTLIDPSHKQRRVEIPTEFRLEGIFPEFENEKRNLALEMTEDQVIVYKTLLTNSIVAEINEKYFLGSSFLYDVSNYGQLYDKDPEWFEILVQIGELREKAKSDKIEDRLISLRDYLKLPTV